MRAWSPTTRSPWALSMSTRRQAVSAATCLILYRWLCSHGWQSIALGRAKGVARALMRDAGARVAQAADVIGIRGVIAHALNQDAHRFYLALGFEVSPLAPMTVMMTLADLKAAL